MLGGSRNLSVVLQQLTRSSETSFELQNPGIWVFRSKTSSLGRNLKLVLFRSKMGISLYYGFSLPLASTLYTPNVTVCTLQP